MVVAGMHEYVVTLLEGWGGTTNHQAYHCQGSDPTTSSPKWADMLNVIVLPLLPSDQPRLLGTS